MKINKRIEDRIKWFKDLYEHIEREVEDNEVAKIVFRTIMFEENKK